MKVVLSALTISTLDTLPLRPGWLSDEVVALYERCCVPDMQSVEWVEFLRLVAQWDAPGFSSDVFDTTEGNDGVFGVKVGRLKDAMILIAADEKASDRRYQFDEAQQAFIRIAPGGEREDDGAKS